MSLLEVTGLSKSYVRRRDAFGRVVVRHRAVRDASLYVDAGETLAVVGESGAGKSTLGRLVLRLIEPDEGRVVFDGTDVAGLGRRDLRTLRRRMQMIFQDPHSSLDPRLPVGVSVGEPMLVHFGTGRAERNGVPPNSSTGSGCPARRRIATQESCPAASCSASRSPGRSPWNPR